MSAMLKGLVIAISLLVFPITYAAASHVDDPVEDRQAVMKHMGTEMKIITPIFAGKAEWDEAQLLSSIAILQENVTPELLQLYQSHIDPEDGSRAKKTIETSWDDFETRMNKLSLQLGRLMGEIPQGNATALATFKLVAQSCSGCHKFFRNRINDR
jgi:cytochrome c556